MREILLRLSSGDVVHCLKIGFVEECLINGEKNALELKKIFWAFLSRLRKRLIKR